MVKKERENEFEHIQNVMSSRKKSLSQRQRPKDFRVHGSIQVEKERENEFQHIQEVVSSRKASFSKSLNSTETKNTKK